MAHTTPDDSESPLRPGTAKFIVAGGWLEWSLICALFFVLGGTLPPDVNESHYLVKARHYWNPDWCPGDPFLESADAHLAFYWLIGWLTRLVSLEATAWIGRFVTWGLLSWAWCRLSRAVIPVPLFAVLIAAMFTTLLDWGHMAGEWVIGGVEAKGFAYVLVLLLLEALVRGRWRSAVVLGGAATACHVLVGGWSLVVLGWSWLIAAPTERVAWRRGWPAVAVAAVLAGLGVVPGLALSWGEDTAIVREAQQIYVFERLSHHLVFHALPHVYIARHIVLIFGWGWLARWIPRLAPDYSVPLRRLNRFVVGAVLLAVAGAVLDQALLYAPTVAAALLRFYWFRLSDVLVPLGLAFAIGVVLAGAQQRKSAAFPWLLAGPLLLTAAHVSWVAWQHIRVPVPGAVAQASQILNLPEVVNEQRYRDWLRVCRWIEQNTPRDALFLTPRHQQSFKWYAGRGEVICAKDIPQDARGIVEWRRRLETVFPYSVGLFDLSAHGEARLRELSEAYEFQYLVLDRDMSSAALTFPRIYPPGNREEARFEVYQVPPVGRLR